MINELELKDARKNWRYIACIEAKHRALVEYTHAMVKQTESNATHGNVFIYAEMHVCRWNLNAIVVVFVTNTKLHGFLSVFMLKQYLI